MEYCGSIINNAVVKIRGERVLCVLLLTILLAGVVISAPSVQFGKVKPIYEDTFHEDEGKEIVPFPDGIQVPNEILRKIEKIPLPSEISLEVTNTPIEMEALTVPEILTTSEMWLVPEAPSMPETPGVPLEPFVPTTPDKPDVPDAPSAEVLPPVMEQPPATVLPPITVLPPETTLPPDTVLPPETTLPPDTVLPPDTILPPETVVPPDTMLPPDTNPTVGFLINGEGLIYGFDAEIMNHISDGVLTLPSEGYTGIAQNAFYGMPEIVCELIIPSNVENIEPGALSGLDDLSWIEVEEGNLCYTSLDGILLDKSITTLVTVPSSRTNFIEVPGSVTRLEAYSFANTHLSEVIMRMCGLVEVSDMVFGNTGVKEVRIIAPLHYLEEYQSVFEGLGVTVVKSVW